MAKFYTSYFYQVRFMKPYQLPCSIAVWDPKWFHNFEGSDSTFFDKNGVLNGVKAEMFVPGSWCCDLCRGPETCHQIPESCEFLTVYRQQLDGLDADEVFHIFDVLSEKMMQVLHVNQPVEFILLFHETPDNPCSERRVVQEWFREHGVEISEWCRR